jgi:hypothetical protein
MTTTVTVKTHDWPVCVSSASDHSYSDSQKRGWGHSHNEEFVPANTERTFNVTNTNTITVRELPKDATGLDQPETGNAACGDRTYPAAAQADIADAGLTVEG